MVALSPTTETSLRTQAAVLAAKWHTRTLCETSFKEDVDAVLCPTALDMEDSIEYWERPHGFVDTRYWAALLLSDTTGIRSIHSHANGCFSANLGVERTGVVGVRPWSVIAVMYLYIPLKFQHIHTDNCHLDMITNACVKGVTASLDYPARQSSVNPSLSLSSSQSRPYSSNTR